MIDFAASRQSMPPDLRPALLLFSGVIAQAIYDAGAKEPKPRSINNHGSGYLDVSDIRQAIYFLFYPGRLEPFADTIGFDADAFRMHLLCGSSAPWATESKGLNRELIRSRACKMGLLSEVQRLDGLWGLRHG